MSARASEEDWGSRRQALTAAAVRLEDSHAAPELLDPPRQQRRR